MKAETLAYKPGASGHKSPDRKRRDYTGRDELVEAFREWLDWYRGTDIVEKLYNHALSLTEGLAPSAEEAHALIVPFEEHPEIEYSGLFLSALYTRVPEKLVVCDFDMPVKYLGYRLPKDKTLVNRREAGNDMGGMASGTVINYGNAGAVVGWGASGTVINYGNAGDWMGENASGIVIAARNPKKFGNLSRACLVLEDTECAKIPELIRYLDSLKERLGPDRPVEEVLANLRDLDIEADIKTILRDAGRLWEPRK